MAFNDKGPTIPILPLGDLNLANNGGTPAIQALQDAFRSGALDFETINRHFNDAPRMAAERLIEQAKAEAAKGEIEIQPLKNEQRKVEGELAIQNARTAVGLQPRIAALKDAELTDAERRQRQRDEAGAIGLREAVQFWQDNNLGPLPQDEQELRDTVDKIQKAKITALQGGVQTAPAVKALVDQFEKAGKAHQLFDANGNMRSREELAKIASEPGFSTQPLNPQQREEEIASLQAGEQLTNRMKSALKILGGKQNVVGPAAGSFLGKAINVGKAVAGFPADQAAFRELEMLSNDLTAAKTKLLKGPLSEKELAFIRASVPQPTDDESTWNKYLTENLPIINASIQARRKALETGAPLQVAPAQAAPTPSAAPTAPLPGGLSPTSDEYQKNWSTATQVTSQTDWSKLQPGTYYIHGGNLYKKQ